MDEAANQKRTPSQWIYDALRDEWDGLDRINRDLRLADLFTLTNALMGLGALVLATQGQTRWAIELVVVGVIMDGLDGAVARMGKGNGPLGGVLDTLADAMTFVATSTVVTFLFLKGSEPLTIRHNAWYLLPLGFYMVCGLLRLARFESLRDDGKVRKYFSGIPSPAAAVTLLSFVLLGDRNWTWLEGWPILLIAFYLGILMVSRVRFPKLRGWGAVVTLVVLFAVLVTVENPDLQALLAKGLLVFMAFYVVLGPFYVLVRHGPTRLRD